MKKFVVFGNPIAHSKSPLIHRLFAEQFGLQIDYQAQLSVESDFEADVRTLQQSGFSGCNVTMPFKLQAFQLADELSERAKIAGAVNTLSLYPDKIVADNTDGQGLVGDLALTISLKGRHILLLGAGGAAKGCIYPLFQAGVSKISIWNRSHEKAQQLAKQLHSLGDITAVTTEQLFGLQPEIIVNSTASSVSGAIPDICSEVFSAAELAYDMFYQDELTSFLNFAQANNDHITLKDGLGMLVGQAAESFRIWHGVQPDINKVTRYLRQP